MLFTISERRAICIMATVILILAVLYFGTTYALPDKGAIPYTSEIQDGALVYLEGVVLDTKITSTGGHLIVNVSGVDVFVPEGGTDLNLQDGDLVKVIGKADTYSGKKEIVTNGILDITVL